MNLFSYFGNGEGDDWRKEDYRRARNFAPSDDEVVIAVAVPARAITVLGTAAEVGV